MLQPLAFILDIVGRLPHAVLGWLVLQAQEMHLNLQERPQMVAWRYQNVQLPYQTADRLRGGLPRPQRQPQHHMGLLFLKVDLQCQIAVRLYPTRAALQLPRVECRMPAAQRPRAAHHCQMVVYLYLKADLQCLTQPAQHPRVLHQCRMATRLHPRTGLRRLL
jgi:hypothetical protein